MKNANHYKFINLKRPVPVPGSAVPKSQLQGVDGVPHSGGIDVVLGHDIVTVPWAGIVTAVRAIEVPK